MDEKEAKQNDNDNDMINESELETVMTLVGIDNKGHQKRTSSFRNDAECGDEANEDVFGVISTLRVIANDVMESQYVVSDQSLSQSISHFCWNYAFLW